MEKKERIMLKKLMEINTLVINNLNENNSSNLAQLLNKFEVDLKNIFNSSEIKELPIWRNFSNMTDDQIRQEFSNTNKYPDLKSIKLAVKGFLAMQNVSQVKTRETLIEHIISTYKQREHIGEFGRRE